MLNRARTEETFGFGPKNADGLGPVKIIGIQVPPRVFFILTKPAHGLTSKRG